MNKGANKKSKKIFDDVDAIYSYILTADEIKKLSNDIVNLLKVKKQQSTININEKDILLITYADTIKSKDKKPLIALYDFLKTFIKK